MLKGNIKYIIILLAALLAVIVVEWLTPKPINWTPTFALEDTNPFGDYVMFDLLPDIFPGNEVNPLNANLYESNQQDSLPSGNYLFVCTQLNMGEEDTEVLLGLAHAGSHIFIATNYFPKHLRDTLQFETENIFFTSDSIALKLANPLWKGAPFYYKRVDALYAFRPAKRDSIPNYEILGTTEEQKPNFIRIRFGKGWFYLNSIPLAYTNYNMLYRQNAQYISRTFSYLPLQPTYWDEYYKDFKTEPQTPLRYIISQPSLKWSLYLSLGALILFIVFEAKRKQRIIPVIKPLTNTTLEFTETVGRLYFQYKDHKNIAEKKITYFLEYLRTHFYVKTIEMDDALYTTLANKTGIDKTEITHLFQIITMVSNKNNVTEEDLLTLNSHIEQFQRKSKTENFKLLIFN